MTMAKREQSNNRAALVAIIAAVTAMSISFSHTVMLISLLMEEREHGSGVIGLMGALPALAFLIASPFIPGCIRYFGSRFMLWVALLVTASSIWALTFSDNIYYWFLLRLLIGMAMAVLFLISEAWLNQISHEKTRGRTVAIYTTFMSLGYALGPMLINMMGVDGILPFLISTLISLSAGIAFLAVGDRFPDLDRRSQYSLFSFIRAAPIIGAATLLVAFFDGSVIALLAVYGVKNGQTLEIAALMLSALLIGNILLQYPIGWLADRIDRGKVILGCGVIGATGSLMLPLAMPSSPFLWPLLIIWGGAVMGAYTVALAIMGRDFKDGDLMMATTVVTALWGIGNLFGPLVAGLAMVFSEQSGLPVTFAAICLIFIATVVLATRR